MLLVVSHLTKLSQTTRLGQGAKNWTNEKGAGALVQIQLWQEPNNMYFAVCL